jgi:hypothetical protein
MPESYAETEARIEQALHKLHDCEKPNIAAMAREFQVPVSRLRARWSGRPSKQDRPGPNKKLGDDQELAVCLYIQRLDAIGTSASFPMVTSCANSILRLCHSSRTTPLPTVDSCWTSRFLQRHPEFHIRKQKTPERRKQSHPEIALERLQEHNAEPRSPSPLLPPQHPITTPHTVRSLKRHAEFLETADLPSMGKRFKESIKKFVKGSLAQAEVAAVMREELSKTKAAEVARANRQSRTRRSVQKK